jgi:hypothetical protein
MTFLDALAEAEKTGAVLTRRPETDRPDYLTPDNPHAAWDWWALNYDGKTILRFYWSSAMQDQRAGIHHQIMNHLTLEDVRANDWQAHPLEEWFLRQQGNVWNPLRVGKEGAAA